MNFGISHCWTSLGLCIAVASAGCGGGGSVNDGTVPLQLSPDKVDVFSDSCSGPIRGPEVLVTGGVPPITIHNPFPQYIRLSTTALRESGETFRVDMIGGACLTDVPIQITDADANTLNLVVNFQER
jgi:hypothetical protein